MTRRKITVLKWSAAAFCLIAFFMIALNLDSLDTLDLRVYQTVSRLINPASTGIFKGITFLASPVALLVISAVMIVFLRHREYRIPLLANLSVAVLLNLGLKNAFMRARPTDVFSFVTETGYSFPSGHTMAATAFYGFLIFVAWQSLRTRRTRALAVSLLSMMILLIGLSRIYLGAHYFSDVLAGLLISCAYLIVFCGIVNKYLSRGYNLPIERNTAKKNEKLGYSFVHAFDGIVEGLKSERNMMIHFGAMTLVITFGAILGLSATEWIVCVLLFGVVFAAELINTAIETVVDIAKPNADPRAKIAKDTAAGAVLAVAIAAFVIGLIIFAPKLYAAFIAGH